jgi:soluble lytic murein transglycosylase-like protein
LRLWEWLASTLSILKVPDHLKTLFFVLLCLWVASASAGSQREEQLADSVRVAMSAAVADLPPPTPYLPTAKDQTAYQQWLAHTQVQLERKLKDKKGQWRLPELGSPELQLAFLQTVWYESRRAAVEPALVMGLMEVESGFRKFAISSAGARGVMQVMPFWTRQLGAADAAVLFQWQANMRFGCVILRHYLALEKGDLHMALGRYNGSRGQLAYPQAVLAAQQRWQP